MVGSSSGSSPRARRPAVKSSVQSLRAMEAGTVLAHRAMTRVAAGAHSRFFPWNREIFRFSGIMAQFSRHSLFESNRELGKRIPTVNLTRGWMRSLRYHRPRNAVVSYGSSNPVENYLFMATV
jgi:hypothetical protein